MVFAPDFFPVDDFNGVVLAGIVLEVAVLNRAVLTAAENFRREHDLNLVPGEGNYFATRLQWIMLLLLHSVCFQLECDFFT